MDNLCRQAFLKSEMVRIQKQLDELGVVSLTFAWNMDDERATHDEVRASIIEILDAYLQKHYRPYTPVGD